MNHLTILFQHTSEWYKLMYWGTGAEETAETHVNSVSLTPKHGIANNATDKALLKTLLHTLTLLEK